MLMTVPAAVPVIRVGISRTPNEIVCHYVPWYQGSFYQIVGVLLLFPSCLALGVSGLIPRGAIQAIDAKRVAVGEGTSRQLSLVYDGVGAQPETIQIGLGTRQNLSVKVRNLERALAEWKNGSSGDPELLDRVEALLRGCRLS